LGIAFVAKENSSTRQRHLCLLQVLPTLGWVRLQYYSLGQLRGKSDSWHLLRYAVMLLRDFFRKKILTNRWFIGILLPYLLWCLTVGGFQDSCCHNDHGNYVQQLVSDNTNDIQVGVLDDFLRYDSETCQICEWLKDSPALPEFVILNIHADFICNSLKDIIPNPVFSYFSTRKFTIRPPPQNV
jgi:hypothetical protein